ncbi:alpha-amylase family glycosyl hydrolase [Pseudarthrobacter sp. H2]|uniref:alpha-amylase family glycosyl hydrolase n=1 Tax=Pseudarthrobacter sp. H2 TaxID=3418415 RepID=UPI003CF1A7B5
MTEVTGDDGCPAFIRDVQFEDAMAGCLVQWGVRVDGPQGSNVWGINLELPDANPVKRFRQLRLPEAGQNHEERYRLTFSRYLGAQKFYDGGAPAIRFAAWAPNAQSVEVVFGRTDNGYIADDGSGIDPAMPVIVLDRKPGGIWESPPSRDFPSFTGLPYMFRIRTAQGATKMRTDIHSRWQIGRGDQNPAGAWNGTPATLDGGISCSVIVDQDIVREEFEPTGSPPAQLSDEDFWLTEFTAGRPVPTRVQDLVVYELHVGSLGFGRTESGKLSDAMELVQYLDDLGVNAVELLPMSETSGTLSWGYGDTHHFVIESSSGGRDKYKHFVRECHRHGIAVIQDVVYNHFDSTADRAEWEYDSNLPAENIYYWYEGRSSDYRNPDGSPNPRGGYLENGSSGWAPRYWEEPVRQLFISSAAEFIEEFHVDGLRVDLTSAIHGNNRQLANGWEISRVNLAGQQLLREWSRTLRMIRPTVMLIAEDHSGWGAVTEPPDVDGLGFDSTWYADFYHDLIGDADRAAGKARLLKEAGYGHDDPLAMSRFADSLWHTRQNKVAYHESHDEAGNDDGSLRTSKAAVNDAPLFGATRDAAEARSRVAAGLAILSAGTPMFFMGEEIVAQKLCKYNNISVSKEDLHGERTGLGATMFRFYQDVIRLSRENRAVRSREIDVLHACDPSRVIAFTRNEGTSRLLVVASLNNRPFPDGYIIESDVHRLQPGMWKEIFNSDSSLYGGTDLGNFSAALPSLSGQIKLRLPANGFVVLQRT